ncbi:MAG: hypothetical protein ACRCRV_03090 [Cetobacterium sp.]
MEICKWKYNADSPVIFMIDDLCNSWVDSNGNGKIDLGEDFGWGKYEDNSSMKFLEDKILKKFPYIKVNFYVPVGKRIGMLKNSSIKMYSEPINIDINTINFYKSIFNNPKYELSYHGTTHGQVFEKAIDQKQEWECFSSLEEAIAKTNEGRKIFKSTVGIFPKGGKYCGYIGDKYGDESINETDFLWWQRYWNKGIEQICEERIKGPEKNPLKAYDITTFGDKKVIDIPSTISGSLFNLKSTSKLKTIIKWILKNYFLKKRKKELDFLLDNKLVISIQEHICPARDDGKRQTPNIFDDRNSLIKIFKYLKDKNVWYCTCTELAEYYYLRENIKIIEKENIFSFDLTNITKEILNKEITLKFDNSYTKIQLPTGDLINLNKKTVTLTLLKGDYILLK